MANVHPWQISGKGPRNYELFAVGRHLGALAQRFVEQAPLRPGARVLDVACGTGIVARLAAPKVAPSGQVVGLDINAGMLEVAQKVSLREGLTIVWKQGNATALPFADSEFEFALCQQGLQFISDRIRALREMRRVLAPGGRIGLNVSGAPNQFQVALAEGLSEFVDADVANASLAPFAMRDPAELKALLADAGFREIAVHTLTLERRIEPTQEWLLQYTSALPYADAIAGMPPAARAEMLRDVARKIRRNWATDSFIVPWPVHVTFAER